LKQDLKHTREFEGPEKGAKTRRVSEILLLTPSDSLARRGIAKRGRRPAVKVKTNREIEETEKKVMDHTGRFESEARSARCEMPVIREYL
jgi:hypothetical protein